MGRSVETQINMNVTSLSAKIYIGAIAPSKSCTHVRHCMRLLRAVGGQPYIRCACGALPESRAPQINVNSNKYNLI